MAQQRYRGRERGQATAEFAVVVPVLALIVLGMLDLGRGVYAYIGAINAAREGARYCALHADASSSPTARVQDELSGPLAVTVTPSTCAPVGSEVQVTVTWEFAPATPLVSKLFVVPVSNPSGHIKIKASAAMPVM